MAVKKTVRLNGIIATAVAIGERPCTIWIYNGTVKLSAASSATTASVSLSGFFLPTMIAGI